MKTTFTDINQTWLNRWVPDRLRPYALLMRLDRPVGVWLLLWPCWWSLLLASDALSVQVIWWGGLCALGALIMRGAGCVVNDLADQEFDAQVARTKQRPLPSGAVSRKQAAVFALFLALLGLMILLQFNWTAVIVGALSIIPVCIYPFMKRITYWPQAVLGLTFNWGALLGWVAVQGTLDLAAVFLYLGAIFWTVGYDTIYAHQDRADDILVGVKSTALKFGAQTKVWVSAFYMGATIFWALAGLVADSGAAYFLGVAAMTLHFIWQVIRLDIEDAHVCLGVFKSNILAGGLLTLGCLVDLFV